MEDRTNFLLKDGVMSAPMGDLVLKTLVVVECLEIIHIFL